MAPAAPEGDRIADEIASTRFRVVRELGSGGMGKVYEAYDRDTDAVVALKMLRRVDGDALYRFKHEFRALADIQHPNLIRFGELLCEEGQWFFTMELVRGRNFHDFVRTGDQPLAALDESPTLVVSGPPAELEARADAAASPPGPASGYDEERLRSAAQQLARAIHALHLCGRVHRDLKPSNVLVRQDGHLVLLDFGLIDEIEGHGAGAGDGLVVGTPHFMAPEQALNQHVEPAADWYSFGVMLFLALTGRLPFSGSAEDVLQAKRTRDAVAPSDVLPGIPDDLNRLCIELLARDPARRPSGEQVLQRLGVVEPAVWTSAASPAAELANDFVGRGAELGQLEEAFARCQKGAPELVLVRGEPGMGKTTLVRRFLDGIAVREPSTVVLAGRCYEQELVPFKAFDTVIDSLSAELARLPAPVAADLLRSGVRGLASLFPVLKRVPVVAERAATGRAVENALALRLQAFSELKDVLARLAERVPLVVFIDDIQWADRDSLALLQALFGGRTPPRALLVATARMTSQSEPSDGALGAELAGLPFRALDLHALDSDEARALWQRLWARIGAAEGAVESRDVDELLDEAAGHPMFLSELVRSARTSDGRRERGAHLQDVLWRRVAELDPQSRRFMEMVALAGMPIDFQVVAQAAGLDPGDCAHLLGALRSGQMIRVSRRGNDRLVEPYHDRLREAIVRHLRGPEAPPIERLHLQLGRRLLERTSDKELPAAVFAIVNHLNAAAGVMEARAERRRLAELNLIAAQQAKLATANAAALQYVERGLALLDGDPWASDYEICRSLHWERMEAEYLAGDRERALERFAELLERLRTDEERTDLYITKMGLDAGTARHLDGVTSGREALARFGVTLPERPGQGAVLAEYARVRWAQGRRNAEELVDLPELQDRRLQCVTRLLVALAPAAFFVSTNLVMICLLRVARISLRHGVNDASGYGMAGFGAVLSGGFGKYEEGHAFGELALALQERFGNPRLASKLLYLNGAYLTPWVRPYAEAIAQLHAACAAGLKNGDWAYETYAAATLPEIVYCRAEHVTSIQACAETARAITARRQDPNMTSLAVSHLRHCMALRGQGLDRANLGTAESSDEAWLATLDDAETPSGVFHYYYFNAQLAYLYGDAARARTLLRQAERRQLVIFSVTTTVELHLWRLLVAARLYADASAAERLRLGWTMRGVLAKLARWARLCPDNFAPLERLAVAEHARALGRAEAAQAFTDAIECARAHGHGRWEALALELAAQSCRERGEPAQAEAHLREAIAAYARWGADAKAEQLRAILATG